jgi:hypothetical protein
MHTPGPWKVWKLSSGITYVCETEERGRHSHFCQVQTGYFWPEGEENARLIAAAPDLLEALRQSLDWMAFATVDYRDDDPPLTLARAAISKATTP